MVFRASDETGPGMAGVQNNLGKTRAAAKSAELTLKQVGKGFEQVGAAAAVTGAALAAGLGMAVAQAAKFQFGVASVVTEADAAKLPAAEISKIAKEMSMTYGGDLNDQVKALYQGVAAGADTAAKATELLNGANLLAIAGQTDQATALLGITKVLNNYNMGFERSKDVADAFFVAVKGGQTTVGELGESIGQVAALAKNAGFSMEELIGSLGVAATKGKDTATATAELKAALSGIAHPTADAAAEAARLGIKFDSVTLRSKGLVGFMKDITSSSKFSADSMNKLFGSTEAAAFMSTLAADNMSALTSMMADMDHKAGGAQKAFDTMSGTLQQTASILKANLQVALVEIGTAFLPLITYAAKFITMLVKGFLGLPDPVKKAVAMFTAVAAVVLTVTGVVAGLIGALLTMELPLAAIGIAAGAVVGAIGPLVIIGTLLAAVIVGVKRAFDQNIGGLKDTVIPLFEKVELTFRALSQAFSQGGFSGAVREELNKGNEPIKWFVVNVYSFAMRIKNFIDGLVKGFESASNAAGPTFARFAIALDKLGGALGRLFGGKQDPDKAAQSFDRFGEAGGKVGAVLEKIAEVVVTGFTYAIDFVTSFIDTASGLSVSFGGTWTAVQVLWSAFGDLFSALGQVAAAFSSSDQTAQSSGATFATLVAILAECMTVSVRIVALFIGSLVPAIQVLAAVVQFVGAVFRFVFDGIKRDVLNLVSLIAKAVDAVASLGGKDLGLSKSLDAATGKGAPPVGGGASSWLAPSAKPAGAKGSPSDALVPMNTPQVAVTPAAPLGTTPVTSVPTSGTTPLSSPTIASTQNATQTPSGAMTPEQLADSFGRAMKAAPPPQASPVIVPVYLDSTKIAEASANAQKSNAARGFQPAPLPSG